MRTTTVSAALRLTETASTSTGNAPLTVNFTSTPSGGRAPYTYGWAFGDGVTSTAQNPTHIYSGAGNYGANLTVTDANGATANATAISVAVHGPLSAVASASPSAGDAPMTVAFTSSGTRGTTPYGDSWAFGDGGTATAQNPSHIYSAAGTFTG